MVSFSDLCDVIIIIIGYSRSSSNSSFLKKYTVNILHIMHASSLGSMCIHCCMNLGLLMEANFLFIYFFTSILLFFLLLYFNLKSGRRHT